MPNGRRYRPSGIFSQDFVFQIRNLVRSHHVVYPDVPPQGIYFESLVEHAFRLIRLPYTPVKPTSRNQPTHDLLVAKHRISLKTETGAGTNPTEINITKLCTTEREPWNAETLIVRVMAHLSRYDIILMLRATWELPVIHYQLLEIPVEMLRLVEHASLEAAGWRPGRRSLGAAITQGEEVIFRVFFDASDGKCKIGSLGVGNCTMLGEWDLHVQD